MKWVYIANMICSHGGSGVCNGDEIVILAIALLRTVNFVEMFCANMKWVLLVDLKDEY